ncbi:MAG: hypothetical protein JST54_18250 [Deltaproteobacteria bacterium]|nr:hypothetical protein [Deltaproteobacteria bacterium]
MPSSLPREYLVQARALIARVCVYEPVDLQAVAAARELALLEPDRAAFIVGALLELSRTGGRKEIITIDAVGRAILSAPPEQLSHLHRSRILDAAHDNGLAAVSALFIAPDPVLALGENVRQRQDPVIAHMTLGHKKMLARKADPDLLSRLAAEADPRVVRNILVNPRLTEPVVVRICARRPIRGEVLRLVHESRRWSSLEKVREAIVQNPYCEPELALKLLPTLSQAMLRLIARNQTLHTSIRGAAARLVDGDFAPVEVADDESELN